VDVTVTTPSGTSGTSAADHFTYAAAPVPAVSLVTPASGPTAGGTIVTILGSNFTGASAVTFGGTAATNFKVVSDTAVVATAPPHAAGTVDVTVTTPSGTSAQVTADHYTYVGGGNGPSLPGGGGGGGGLAGGGSGGGGSGLGGSGGGPPLAPNGGGGGFAPALSGGRRWGNSRNGPGSGSGLGALGGLGTLPPTNTGPGQPAQGSGNYGGGPAPARGKSSGDSPTPPATFAVAPTGPGVLNDGDQFLVLLPAGQPEQLLLPTRWDMAFVPFAVELTGRAGQRA